MNVYVKNKEENNDLKSGKNCCHYPAIFSLKIDCASFLSTYHSYYKIFSWKKFSREHVFVTLANSREFLFWKIKSTQEHCQNKVE